MKILCLLITVYLFSLPCLFLDSSCGEDEHEVVSASEDSGHCEEDSEVCSPLCICSCCGTSVLSNANSFDINFFLTKNIQSPHSLYYHIKEISIPVWHPPKIS